MRLRTFGIIVLIVVLIVIIVLMALGFNPLGSLAGMLGGDDGIPDDAPADTKYCGYSESEIINIIEDISGKNLNQQAGIGFARALNMTACSSNLEPSTISNHYRNLYSDWHLYDTRTDSGSGWTSETLVWTNDPTPVNSTFVKAIIIINGITVEELSDYETFTLTSDGTLAFYLGFLMWVNAS